jgi:hypothetical protein
MVKKGNEQIQEGKQSKKIAPLVLSIAMLASTFVVAGAPASAAELEARAKNHGDIVSEVATSTPGSLEKGEIMQEVAKDNNEREGELSNEDREDDTDNIDEEGSEEPISEEDADNVDEEEGSEELAGEDDSVNTDEEVVNEDALVNKIYENYQSIFDHYEQLIGYADSYIQSYFQNQELPTVTEEVESEVDEAVSEVEEVEPVVDEVATEVEEGTENVNVEADSEAEVETDTHASTSVMYEGTLDKLVGYYEKVKTAYSNFISFLK